MTEESLFEVEQIEKTREFIQSMILSNKVHLKP